MDALNGLMAGKKGLVMGVANDRSIAWGIAKAIAAGAHTVMLGGMFALHLRDMTLNVASAVGFITLFGVSVQNGVILVSGVNELREHGVTLEPFGEMQPAKGNAVIQVVG